MTQNDAYLLRDDTYRRGRTAIALAAVVGWTASAAGYIVDPQRFFEAAQAFLWIERKIT